MLKNHKISDKLIDLYEKKFLDYPILDYKKISIYGTGNGAEIIYQIMSKHGWMERLFSILDNDDVANKNVYFHDIPVKRLDEGTDESDAIVIASMDYHSIVKERVCRYFETISKEINILDPFGHNTNDEIREYVEFIESRDNIRHDLQYKEYECDAYERTEKDTKVIAWYLPQYHRIATNDEYHGRGFTEWTNTTSTIPMFPGHYQPHIPYDLGYYNLNDSEVLPRQIELAKHYGVYGFSFYYYWFSGTKIMEKPLDYIFDHPELDMKYCLTWANENWSALWDGGNKELIYEQKLNEGDDIRFIADIGKYLKDPRYLEINGKKILLIYQINMWSQCQAKKLLNSFREESRRMGIGELYIILCATRKFDEDAEMWGGDALVEFPPHGVARYAPVIRTEGYLNPNFVGCIRDFGPLLKDKKYLEKHNSKIFYRGVMTSWDNTPRKAYSGATIYKGLSPKEFEQWMYDAIKESREIHSDEENYVFVNAWNEWAESAHLEPDMKYGYANLAAVKRALERNRN